MSTLSVNTVKSLGSSAPVFQNSSGNEKGQLAKAWVAWDSLSTLSIYDDFNVSSITDDGVGNFTVNIDIDMANNNYAVVASTQGNGSVNGSNNIMQIHGSNQANRTTPAVGAFKCCILHPANGVNQDVDRAAVVVFGD